jgi:hypothetical protein
MPDDAFRVVKDVLAVPVKACLCPQFFRVFSYEFVRLHEAIRQHHECREKIFILLVGFGRAAHTGLLKLINTQNGTMPLRMKRKSAKIPVWEKNAKKIVTASLSSTAGIAVKS